MEESGSDAAASMRNRMQLRLSIKPSEESSLSSFPEFFAHFLSNFGGSLEIKIGEISVLKSQSLSLDCADYLAVL